MTTGTIVHLAGQDVQVGSHLRQRCSWCGAVLIDEDLTRISYQVGDDSRYPTWEVGAFVPTTAGDQGQAGYTFVIEHTDGEPVPADCCARLDPDVTL